MKMINHLSHICLLLTLAIKSHGIEKSITQKDQYATIIGLVPKSAGIDSVSLFLYPENTASDLSVNITGMVILTSKVKNGKYFFNIPINDKLHYFSLYKNESAWPESKGRLINLHLVEKGDYVVVNHFGPNITFSGEGSAKHTLHYHFSNVDGYEFNYDNPLLSKTSRSANMVAQHDLRCEDTLGKIKRLLQLLEKVKADLSEKSYQVLYCEIIGNCQYPLIRVTRNLTGNFFKIAQANRDAIKLQFGITQKDLMRSMFADSITAYSLGYVKYYFELLKLQRALSNDTTDLVKYIINSTHKSEFRDKLLISVIGLSFKRYGKYVQFALDHMHSPAMRKDLLKFFELQKDGAMVPKNFLLKDQNNDEIDLSSYAGKVIFLDFWYVGCHPCEIYYRTIVSVAKERFKNSKDVVFVSVCTEKEYLRWISALQSNLYTSQSQVNLFTAGKQMNHSIIRYFNIVSAPTPLLIDKNFKIFTRDEFLLGRGSNANALIKTIELCLKN